MKKAIFALATLVVVLLIAAVVAPFLIPADTYKEKIIEAARDATGRDLSLNGDIAFSVLPRLELRAEDVAFANAPGAASPQMARMFRFGNTRPAAMAPGNAKPIEQKPFGIRQVFGS